MEKPLRPMLFFVLLLFTSAIAVSADDVVDDDVSDDQTIEYCGGNNIIEGSTITDSEVRCSDIKNAGEIIDNSVVEYAVISGDSLVSGKLQYLGTGYTYYGPRKLDDIYNRHLRPSPLGTAGTSTDYIAPGDSFHITYSSGSTGYSVTADVSSVVEGEVSLKDDGEGNDQNAHDGIYTSPDITVDPSASTGEYEITIYVDDNVGNEWELTISIYVDADPPTGSLEITASYNTSETESTSSRLVFLYMTAGDVGSGVDGCRLANEDEDIEEKSFRSCESFRTWLLTPFNDEKVVTYQIRDRAGNIRNVTDSITLAAVELYEPPQIEMSSQNWPYTDHIDFRMFYEDVRDFYEGTRVFYDDSQLAMELAFNYTITDSDGNNIIPWRFTSSPRVLTSDFPEFEDGEEYTIKARARMGNWSPTGTLDFNINTTPPQLSVVPSISEGDWTSEPVISFDMEADGIDISGFSYRISENGSMPNTNVDIPGEQGTAYISGTESGIHEFVVIAVTEAGYHSEPYNFTLHIDTTLPPPPDTSTPAVSGTGTLRYHWEHVDTEYSPIDHYNVQIASDEHFEYIVHEANVSSGLNYTDFTAEKADTYFFRVRAMNEAGTYGPFSTESDAFFDTEPPRFLARKPEGRIASQQPILYIETDKDSRCFYGHEGETPDRIFEITGGRIHETMLELEEGEHTIPMACYDHIGNFLGNTTVVDVDTSITPSSISLTDTSIADEGLDAYTSSFQDVEILLEDAQGPIGELPSSDFSVFMNGNTFHGYTLNDLGEGNYILSLELPEDDGNHLLEICYDDDLCHDIPLYLSDMRLEVFTDFQDDVYDYTRMHYTEKSGIIVGFGSDSDRAIFPSSESDAIMSMSSISGDGNDFVFFVPSDATESEFDVKNRMLRRQTFLDSPRSRFYGTSGEDMDLKIDVIYGNVKMHGEGTFPRGGHNLLIRNEGFTGDSRVNISFGTE